MKPFIRVRQTGSLIGQTIYTRKVVHGLGLRRIGSEVTVQNTPSFRGMIKKAIHLLHFEEIDAPKAAK